MYSSNPLSLILAFRVAYDSAEGSRDSTLFVFSIAAYRLKTPMFAPISHKMSPGFNEVLIHSNVSGSLLS